MSKLFISLLFLLLLQVYTQDDLSDSVLITRISNTPVDGKGSQASAMGGGSLFYIKGSGFDLISDNNKVFIGDKQAKVMGANAAFLMFESIPQTIEGRYPVRVSVWNPRTNKEKTMICWADCGIYYAYWATAELRQIKPRSAGPNEYVNFMGAPRFTSSNEIENIKIGEFICDRVGLDEVTYTSWDSNSLFNCRVAPEMEAGYYNSSFKVKDKGYSKNLPSFPSLSPKGEIYDFKCMPLVSEVSSNIGSPNGQVIKIKGHGFSPKKDKVEVIAGNYPCDVLSSDLYEIECEVQKESLNQTLFTKGVGIEKWVYDASVNSEDIDLRSGRFQNRFWSSNITLPLISYSVESEPDRTPANDEANILEAWDGYFKPPVDGNYRFYVSANCHSELYLSRVPNSSNTSDLEKIAYYYSCSTYEGPFYNDSQRSVNITLKKDQYYRINAFRNAYTWGSHFWVGVEVPSEIATVKSVQSAQSLEINFETFRECQEIKIYNFKTMGTFKIVVAAKNPGGNDFYKETSPMKYDIYPWDLSGEVSRKLGWSWPNVERFYLFENGTIITDRKLYSSAKGYLFRINFTIYRAEVQNRPIQPKIVLVSTDPTQQPFYSIVQIQQPSVPLSGNITLSFNGTLLEPFPITSNSIYDWIAKIPGLDRGVYADRLGDPQDNHKYVFRLSGLTDVPVMTVVSSEAEGGLPGTKPNITVREIIYDSNNTFYSPIPSEMLFVKSTSPQIIVRVNDVIGKCELGIDCKYSINSTVTPILKNYSLTTTGLKLILSNYNYAIINKNTTTVKFANSICKVSSVSLPNVYCNLPKTPNNTFELEAGSHKPQIHIENIGYSLYDPSIQDYFVPLQVSSLSHNQGSTQGGQILNLNGNGFPYSHAGIQKLSVTLGGVQAEVIKSTNNLLTIRTPVATDKNNKEIIVKFNDNAANSNDYQYSEANIPIVSSISPRSASPALKTICVITGNNFGNDSSKVTVKLVPQEKTGNIYELSVINCSQTVIYAVLGGGKVGSYELKVEVDGIGASKQAAYNAALFKYELIVYSISPNTGSVYGGTKLIIKGVNFSPVLKQNQVYIGDNNYCTILESNSSTIVCETREALEDTSNEVLPIYITQRVQEEAICQAKKCEFVYDNTTSPRSITAPSKYIFARARDIVTINGSNLYPDIGEKAKIYFIKGNNTKGVFDMNLEIDPIETSATYLKFLMPELEEGAYNIKVYIGNNGWAWIDPEFTIVTPIEVHNIIINDGKLDNSQNLVSRGGAAITIFGNGFSDEIVYIDNNVWWCPVIFSSRTVIKCITRDIWTENTYKVYVYRDSKNKYSCNNCSFTVASSKSPYVWAGNCSGSGLGPSILCVLTGDNLNLSYYPVPYLDDYSSDGKYMRKRIQGETISVFKKNITIAFENVPNNTYRLNIYYEPQGHASINSAVKSINIGIFDVKSEDVMSSYLGGKNLSVSAKFLPNMSVEHLNNITICGSICKILDYNAERAICKVPKLINPQIMQKFQIQEQESIFQTDYDVYADNEWPKQFINDKKLTSYYDSTNSFCYLLFDFKQDYLFQAQEIHYYPTTARNVKDFIGLAFQGSYDGTNWDLLFTLDKNIKTGWNVWSGNSPSYRFFRMQSQVDKHVSRCQMAEIKFYGVKYYGKANTMDLGCEAILNINGYSLVLPSLVLYNTNSTPIAYEVTPNIGPTSGGTTISISGKSFGYDKKEVLVFVDGVPCEVRLVSDEKVVCVTGVKDYFSEPSLEIVVKGNNAILQGANFSYIDRWSDPKTWGGETPPREGDSVYIPAGQSVLLDVSTPILNSVIVEGSLIFEDKDKNFSAHYLICMNGKVQIGTFSRPFKSKLLITMYGQKDDIQLPEFGNKVWAFHNGILDIHGLPKKVTWTLLAKTAYIGDSSITLMEEVDWKVNDEIVIASTDFDHNHSETRRISRISTDLKTITLNSPLQYKHYSDEEQFESYTFPMRAEVALLTRNIVFQGVNDEYSYRNKYGAHLMLHMPGAIGRISFTEFRYVGQGFIIGRYPMHFHRIDDASESFAIGNAVHESYARVIAIHDTHFLRVQRNVGYRIYGHSYFIEDGIETNNLLEDNLGISTIQIWTLIDSDTTAATFWITNPNNIVRRNRAAGGDWFGYWYQLDNRATGPSSNPNICPDGIPLGEFSDNVAHSYNAFGLRIYEYAPRTYPCEPHSLFKTDDFYEPNPPIPAVFENFVAWKNNENGVMAEHLGSVELRNFLIADSRLSGMQISMTNFTREDEVKINGALIVGLSKNSQEDQAAFNESVGLTTPRTDNLLVKGITFFNFFNSLNMSAMKSCSKCWHFKLKITGGKTTKFSNLTFKSVDRKVVWDGTKKEVFIDLDGTLLGGKGGSLTAYYPHIASIPECKVVNETIYDHSIVCDQSVSIRPIMFRNAQPNEAFRGLEIKAVKLSNANDNISLVSNEAFTSVVMYKIFVDTVYTWSLPFVTGYTYNIHFQNGNLDFTHLNVYPSNYWRPEDKGVVLRFNYSEIKDDFNTTLVKFQGKLLQGKRQSFYLDPKSNNYFTSDYYHDKSNKYFFLGVNGKSNGTIDIDPIKCLENCNNVPISYKKEAFSRKWSNTSMWNNSRLPQNNEEVYIPPEWNLVIDMSTANLSKIIIDGDVTFDSSKDNLKLIAGIIWVRLGNLTAGSPESPLKTNVEIILTGSRNSPMIFIDPFIDVSNKAFIVTGSLKLFGASPKIIWTRLAENVYQGDNKLKLIEPIDWKVGDEIVVGPSEFEYTQHEKRKVTAISTDKKIVTLDNPVSYFHYGDANITYTSDFGQILDMRTAVGLLTRNIIIKGDGQDNWGSNILVYQFIDNSKNIRRGYAQLEGVEIKNGGHPDTERASLDFKFLKDEGPLSFVRRSSIHSGYGWGVNVYASLNVTIEENVFYNCEKFLTRSLYSNDFTFRKNLLIFPRKRNLNEDSHLYDMVAGLDMYEPTKNSRFIIEENLVQGSEGNGFVMSATKCGEQSGFRNNHVQSARYIGLIIANNNSYCLEAGDISISKTQGGVWTNFDSMGVSIKRMILAENSVGTQLMFGRESDNNTFLYEKIVFIAAAREKCAYCYQLPSACRNQEAINLPLTTILGKTLPLDKPDPLQLTSICKDAAFDQKLLMSDCLFINYKLDYSKDSNQNFLKCSNNVVFKMREREPDSHSNAYLTNTKIINSDFNALARMVEPAPEFLFWRGGCGDFNCTGEKNWVLTDIDGSFLGEIGQIIPNNKGIQLDKSPCRTVNEWNGRFCKGISFGVLEFQNDGADQRKRIIAPVNITSNLMKTTLNEWREWKWEGPEPLNLRLARFAGIVELNKSLELEFETVVPEELKFQLQKGRPAIDYVIITIKYERPNRIEVWNLNSQTFIKPFRTDQGIDLNSRNMECGANIYDPDMRTIQFVLTNHESCKLRVRTVNSVKVSIRMDSTIEDFYSNNGEALFIDKIAAFLHIDVSRIRIVNVLKGSVIVDFEVVEDKKLTESTSALETDINSPPKLMQFYPLLTASLAENDLTYNNDVSFEESQEEKEKNAIDELQETVKRLEMGVLSGELLLMGNIKEVNSKPIINDKKTHEKKKNENENANNFNSENNFRRHRTANPPNFANADSHMMNMNHHDHGRKLASQNNSQENGTQYSAIHVFGFIICILLGSLVVALILKNKKGSIGDLKGNVEMEIIENLVELE